MDIAEALLRDDVRTLLKLIAASLAALLVGKVYYRVVKEDEARMVVEEQDRLTAWGWLSDYQAESQEQEQRAAA